MNVDECRAAFAEAFEAYAHEGSRMKDLLLSLNNSRELKDFESISEQQARLNDARHRYEEARTLYVDNVLRDFVNRGDSV